MLKRWIIATTLVCMFGVSCSRTLVDKNEVDPVKAEQLLQTQLSIVVNYLDQGKPEKAHHELRQMLVKYPDDARVLNLAGLSYLGLNKPEFASKYFLQAIEQSNQVAYRLNLTSAWIEQKKFQSAAKELRKLMQLAESEGYPYPERIHHNLGLVFERSAKPDRARKSYEEALTLNPSYYPTLIQLGGVCKKLRDQRCVSQSFARAREVCAKCLAPVRELVDSQISKGEKNKALVLLREYLNVEDIPTRDKEEALTLLNSAEEKNSKNVEK